ncbi:OapC/ArvC family zinc-ribbon domain-containing protein [Halorussus ruber]|uniref:OapC/ArvC family zinc-ribbon domain-containing protein n=1 Tax=Halorussus ruber TaxID=1126238 RepID=UPI0010924968|nr:Zn-ribbon containing protein [Halorussus ruber]
MPHQCTTCGRTFEDGSKEMLSGCPDCGGNKFQFQPSGGANAGGSAKNGAGGGATSAATAPKKTPENARTAESARTAGTDTVGNSASAPETGSDDRNSASNDRNSAVNRAAATVRDWVGKRDNTPRDDATDDPASGSTRKDTPAQRKDASARTDPSAPSATGPSDPSAEDSAQASARRDVVTESELPDEPPQNVADAADSEAAAPQNGEVVSAPDDESPGLKELREELNSQFESIRIVEPGQYELNLMELYEREEYIISLQEDGKYVIEVPDAWDASNR